MVRAWTDGSEPKGVDNTKYVGYGVWFGMEHQLNCAEKLPGQRQTSTRAKYSPHPLSTLEHTLFEHPDLCDGEWSEESEVDPPEELRCTTTFSPTHYRCLRTHPSIPRSLARPGKRGGGGHNTPT